MEAQGPESDCVQVSLSLPKYLESSRFTCHFGYRQNWPNFDRSKAISSLHFLQMVRLRTASGFGRSDSLRASRSSDSDGEKEEREREEAVGEREINSNCSACFWNGGIVLFCFIVCFKKFQKVLQNKWERAHTLSNQGAFSQTVFPKENLEFFASGQTGLCPCPSNFAKALILKKHLCISSPNPQ